MDHESYMHRCFQLAKAGKGTVSPNPLVGSIIVYQDKIIGEGYHHHQGGPHAEVMAINSVEDKSLLQDSQIYVTLEPCSHFGKTPPCANLILKHKIPKVFISCKDPHEKVAGKGIALLKNNGVEVIEDILQKEGEQLNRRFFTFHRKKRPYIILKWAESQNGFMDFDRANNEKGIHWITQLNTKSLTHKWRSIEDAILIGRNTAQIDNPSLTTRSYFGKSPTRILIDKDLKVTASSTILDQKIPTIVFNSIKNEKKNNINFIKIGKSQNYIEVILKTLYDKNIQSVIIEGGAQTIKSFIKANLWDEARILKGRNKIINGLDAPRINIHPKESFYYGKDHVSIITNPSSTTSKLK